MAGGLVVVGVGRSGTSIATRLASTLGLRLPRASDLMPANESNPDGHWESTSLAEMNDRLLARIGSTWWTPPATVTPELLAKLAPLRGDALRTFVDVFGTDGGWVWKDPRLTVLLPFWADLVDTSGCLLPYRQPRAVATSVMTRDGLTYAEGLAIWERHTRLLLAACVGRSVAVTSFERLCADPESWSEDLRGFCGRIGLPVRRPQEPARGFVQAPAGSVDGWLTPQQTLLMDLLHELHGQHEKLSLPAPLPDESPWVGDVLARLPLPAWARNPAQASGAAWRPPSPHDPLVERPA